MEKKNEMVIVDKISKQLQEKRNEVVFPLSPMHRRELRILRDINIGNLRSRVVVIKQLKMEEYEKKYSSQIQEEFSRWSSLCTQLNKDWVSIIEKINILIKQRRERESITNIEFLNLENDYNDISELKTISFQRIYRFNDKETLHKIVESEFNKKYKESFDSVSKVIEKLEIQYEEAINFGDLEIVKYLYYTIKNADIIFETISNLKM